MNGGELRRTLEELAALEAALADVGDAPGRLARRWRDSVEGFYREAVTRLIRGLREDAACRERLRELVADPFVYAALRRLGVLRPSLQERVETALESVRPMLRGHGGDVELVEVIPPDRVRLRFLGNCDGCPASTLTFYAGVRKAIEAHCPEITRIEQVAAGGGGDPRPAFTSPFAAGDGTWHPAGRLEEIPEDGILLREVGGERLILARTGPVVSCFVDACAHLGLPLAGGEVRDGVLVCPHHGFRYDLRSGECLTVPEVQLEVRAVRLVGDRVEVRTGGPG